MAKSEVTLQDLFTSDEIERAKKLYREASPGTFNRLVVKEIVEPAMDRINKVTGQENDARYIGYALENVLMQGGVKADDEPPPSPGRKH